MNTEDINSLIDCLVSEGYFVRTYASRKICVSDVDVTKIMDDPKLDFESAKQCILNLLGAKSEVEG